MAQKCILFDFDGVIIDSFKAVYSIMHAHQADLTEEKYRNVFSGNAAEALKNNQAAEPVDQYFKQYEAERRAMPIVPGMKEVVETLAAHYALVIVSSSLTHSIRTILLEAGMQDYFYDILGYDRGIYKTEKIQEVLGELGVSPHETIFITDTLGDIIEAHKVGVRSIGVTWGFQDIYTLQSGSPVAVVDTPTQLLEVVKQSMEERAS